MWLGWQLDRQHKGYYQERPLLPVLEHSQAQKLGLLSLLEGAGLSLTKIEELGLLSTAEKVGMSDKRT